MAYFQQAIKDAVNYHVSLVASNVVAPPPDMYEMWARTNKYAGYRYAVTSATVPASAPAGSALRITVRWTNFGAAPSYDNWQVGYEVRDAADNVVGDRAVWAIATRHRRRAKLHQQCARPGRPDWR